MAGAVGVELSKARVLIHRPAFGPLRTFVVRVCALRCRTVYRCGSAVAVPAFSGPRSRARTALCAHCLFNTGVTSPPIRRPRMGPAPAGTATALRRPPRRAGRYGCVSARQPSSSFGRGLRREAGIEPAARRAPQARVMPAHGLDAWASASFPNRCRWTAKTRVGARRRASAAPSSAGLVVSARSAPRELTRRSCPSVANAVSAASSAADHEAEQHRGRGPQGHARAAAKRRRVPARGFARTTASKLNVRNGPKPAGPCAARIRIQE